MASCSGPARWLLAVMIVALGALPAAIASAQEAGIDRTAAARSLFEDGLRLAGEDRWEEAADRFQRALSLRPSPQITYNLAGTLIELRRFVRASELLRQVATDPTVETAVRDAAEARRQEILPRIGRLTLRIDPSVAGGTVMLDERMVDQAALGVPVPVDPGEHTVSVTRDGRTLLSRRIEIAEAGAQELVLREDTGGVMSVEAATEADVDAALVGPVELEPEAQRSPVETWWFWTTITGAVLVIGGAIVLGVVLASEGGPDPGSGNGDPPLLFVGGGS